MGNLVRESAQSFAAVKFFHTAAPVTEDGTVDTSIEALARWLMQSEGIQFGG
jgi:hypothetical protein